MWNINGRGGGVPIKNFRGKGVSEVTPYSEFTSFGCWKYGEVVIIE